MGFKMTVKGDWKDTKKWISKTKKLSLDSIAARCGADGVALLQRATPRRTGKTADSWYYEIEKEQGKTTIVWKNSNAVNYVSVALILQYGHASKNGSWVEGIDYINPALKPLFEKMANDAWKEVTK